MLFDKNMEVFDALFSLEYYGNSTKYSELLSRRSFVVCTKMFHDRSSSIVAAFRIPKDSHNLIGMPLTAVKVVRSAGI